MKKILVLILICFAQNIFSQTTKENEILILTVDKIDDKVSPQKTVSYDENFIHYNERADVKAEFPGGSKAFDNFIKENYKNPKAEIKGRIYISFIIEKNGSLSNIEVAKDIGYGTGAEAVRLLKTSPKWSPAKIKDKSVRVLYNLPINVN
jgi:hypothetical protein